MELGLAYTNQFDGMKSLTTFDSVPVTLYADGVPYDFTSATKVTLHIGAGKGYVGSMELDLKTDRSLFNQGIISIPANESFMQLLPPDIYYIEVWVENEQGNMIFPSSGVLPFTIDSNLMNTAENGVYSVTLYEFMNNINEMANIIENNQATASKNLSALSEALQKNQSAREELEHYEKGLTETTRKTVYDYTEEGLGVIKQTLNTSGGQNIGLLNHRFRDIKKGINHPELINDKHSQTFHFSTPYGWLNDIQTIVRVKDHWNIYYLNNDIKNSEELASEWYVVQTTDFKTFSDAGVAVHRMPNLWGDVFTGSIVKNKQPDGHIINPNAPVNGYLAFLCGHTYNPETQQMYCAYSDDDALNFHPLDGSLVLPRPAGVEGFRDGKVYYNSAKQEVVMYMVQGAGNDGTEIHTYTSSTGEENTWRDTGILNLPPQTWNNDSPGAYECPIIIENITDKATGEVVDVLAISGNTGPDGMGMFYITGHIDDNGIFQRKAGSYFKRLDYGLDAYAGNFSSELTNDGSAININWIGSWSRPYLDFMKREKNYHLGSFSLPRKLTLRNDVLENEVIEPDSDVLVHWYDAKEINLHEKSSRSKIVAKFNNNISNNKFTFDYGDGQLEIEVTNSKIFVAQKGGIFGAPNGATCHLNKPVKELVFYLDKASLEIYLPSEKKIITQMMLSNNRDVKFISKNPINEMIIRQFNDIDTYGSYKPIVPPDISINKNLVQSATKDDNAYCYRGEWTDDLFALDKAKPGYYSLRNNQINAPQDFFGYGNIEVTHDSTDTFLVLKGDQSIWTNQLRFGNWGKWSNITQGSAGGFGHQGNWVDDFDKLTTAKAGIYAVPGNKVNAPKDFSGFGNIEVSHNETDTFIVLKSEGKIWTNQYSLGSWIGWNRIIKESEAYIYRGVFAGDFYSLTEVNPGYYSLENNKKGTPADFSGYGNVEVTHNDSDTFVTLKSEGHIWTNQFTMGKWTEWIEITGNRGSSGGESSSSAINSFVFSYRGDWTDDFARLTSARTGIYAIPGNTKNAPDDFSGYGNVEVTHNDSDTFVTLKSLGDIWTNQHTFGKWIGWDKNIKESNSYSYHGDWNDDIYKLTGAKQGYYSLSGNKFNGPADFSGYGNIEITHNKSDTFATLKSEGKIWTAQFTLGKWTSWDAILKTSDTFAYHGDWTKDLHDLTSALPGYYSISDNKVNGPVGFSGFGNVDVTHNNSDTFVTLKSEGNIWTTQFTLGKWTEWEKAVKHSEAYIYRGDWTDDLHNLNHAEPGYYSLSGNKSNAPENFSGYGNAEITHNKSDTFVVLKSEGKIWTNQYTLEAWTGWNDIAENDDSFVYRGDWTDDFEKLNTAKTGIYAVPGNTKSTPEHFSGYGNVEVTHNESDTFITLKSEGNIWTNQFTLGKWIGWVDLIDRSKFRDNEVFVYRGEWKDDVFQLHNAKPGYYSLVGNTQNTPKGFLGYGNVEVTHNNSDTFLTLKGSGKSWTTQRIDEKWTKWIEGGISVSADEVFVYRGNWEGSLSKLNKAPLGFYAIPGNKEDGPLDFSGFGNVEVTHNDSDTFVTLKSDNRVWHNQYSFGVWQGWTEVQDNYYIKEIDDAFEIKDPGTYTHYSGQKMKNVPDEVQGQNQYTIHAIGGKTRVKDSRWVRSWINKLILIDVEGNEFQCVFRNEKPGAWARPGYSVITKYEAVDFNDLTTNGRYICRSHNNPNSPASSLGISASSVLDVASSGAGDVFQTLYIPLGGTFRREFSFGKWSSWNKS